ncbi:MAG: hypothetical protein A2V52_08455 [Actinobacteria bacterium RBG_19FT_COMBO_54_7]|uniref:Prepilin-type N-terminal cleavage/methylation domain-containing protein n=1 Tax=Candidatus Solincola sediminis TaxID=1797199 RepID=A0A1F2WRG1_9ACTN|nr:MAG: hypothetical protein A2Y75_11380 [Candidatus Solincola sediminis]OFW59902.1 MAG: hypothetical protein A2W01_07120 [Candidatus Solincola sediminis]OFW68230.1 MAG: hypothetical protein A2V52_08455 [Actinobacteria bacterium RBG_19FT_COMBO_54_7]
MHRQEGFTLIELMIVVLIIGILVGIAVPVFLAASGDAEAKRCASDRRTIKSASNVYASGNAGAYPVEADYRVLLDGYVEDIATIACPTGGTWADAAADGTVPLDLQCSIAEHNG